LERFENRGHALGEADINNIVQRLRAVDLLQDPKGVDMIVELSEHEIGEEIPPTPVGWAGHTDGDKQLRDLVKRLSWRDAAVWVFINTIEDIYGPSEYYDALRAAVGLAFARPVLSREQRQAIHRLCGNLVCSDVATLYRLSVEPQGQPLRSDVGNLRAVLNELENLPVRLDGLHPIVAFVEYLAKQVPEVAEQLHNWTQSIVGTRMPLVQALQAIRQSPVTVPAAAQRYCLVSLDSDRLDPDQFYISVAIQNGIDPTEPLRPPDDQTHSLAEIRRIIGRVLNDPEVNASAGLVIEFLLPMRLINLPVDEWPVSSSQIRLGIRYPVIVRSLTRLRDVIDSFSDWRAKWARARETTFDLINPAVMPVPERAQRNKNQLYARLAGSSAPVCLLLQETPDPAAEDGCDGLMAALQAGVPVLVWCHESGIGITDALRPLLDEAAPLAGLPQRILDYRRQVAASEEASKPGVPRITLLWDDADRIPDVESFLDMPA
jgi:hypothetical protein